MMSIDKKIVLEEFNKLRDKGIQRPMYPLLVIYHNSCPHYARLNYALDFLWFNEVPEHMDVKKLYNYKI